MPVVLSASRKVFGVLVKGGRLTIKGDKVSQQVLKMGWLRKEKVV